MNTLEADAYAAIQIEIMYEMLERQGATDEEVRKHLTSPATRRKIERKAKANAGAVEFKKWGLPRLREILDPPPAPEAAHATVYLSRTDVAARIGVKPDTLGRYKLPEPDAMIGKVRGWLPETIDAWHKARPRK